MCIAKKGCKNEEPKLNPEVMSDHDYLYLKPDNYNERKIRLFIRTRIDVPIIAAEKKELSIKK